MNDPFATHKDKRGDADFRLERDQQMQTANSAMDSFIGEAQDAAYSEGLWRFFRPRASSAMPPASGSMASLRDARSMSGRNVGPRMQNPQDVPFAPHSPRGNPYPDNVSRPGSSFWPFGGNTASAPDAEPCTCGREERRVLAENCFDAFGAGAAEARYWPQGDMEVPSNPKRPPPHHSEARRRAEAAAQRGQRRRGWWPFGSQQSVAQVHPPQDSEPFVTHAQGPPMQELKLLGRPRPPIGALCGSPLGLFLLSALSFALLWPVTLLPVFLVALGLIVSLTLTLPRQFDAKGPLGNGDWLAVCVCLFAAISGTFTGIYAYEVYTGPFYAVVLGREYGDVVASSPGAAYQDGGRFHFARTSAVDYNRVVGFKNRDSYCVAPVVDAGAAQTRKVTFWAVGVNCCSFRGDFKCGDAGNDSGMVKGAARAPPDGVLFRPWEAGYANAIRQAASIYDLEVDEEAILLSWVDDPGASSRALIFCSLGVVLLGAALFALVSLVTLALTAVSDASGMQMPRSARL